VRELLLAVNVGRCGSDGTVSPKSGRLAEHLGLVSTIWLGILSPLEEADFARCGGGGADRLAEVDRRGNGFDLRSDPVCLSWTTDSSGITSSIAELGDNTSAASDTDLC